jgi:hypothetical protein
MASAKQQENMLLTEHFSWPPIVRYIHPTSFPSTFMAPPNINTQSQTFESSTDTLPIVLD